jgi:hypothetical protein
MERENLDIGLDSFDYFLVSFPTNSIVPRNI